MPYRSPLQILKDTGLFEEVQLDSKTLHIAKRAMLAELDLSDDHTYTMNGDALNKQDIIEFFDDLKDERTWKYHEALANDDNLRFFLSEQELPEGTYADNPLYYKNDFKDFIEPYYIEAHISLFRRAFRKQGIGLANDLVHLPQLWSKDGRAKFGLKFNQYLYQVVAKIDSVTQTLMSDAQKGLSYKTINAFCHKNQVAMLTLLPDSTLHLRRQYAAAIIALANQQYDAGENKAAIYLSKNLLEHGIFDEDIVSILEENVAVYTKYVSPESPQGKKISNDSAPSEWQIAWYVIWGLIFLLRLLTAF